VFWGGGGVWWVGGGGGGVGGWGWVLFGGGWRGWGTGVTAVTLLKDGEHKKYVRGEGFVEYDISSCNRR